MDKFLLKHNEAKEERKGRIPVKPIPIDESGGLKNNSYICEPATEEIDHQAFNQPMDDYDSYARAESDLFLDSWGDHS